MEQVWLTIAQYIPAHPQSFTRLAQINLTCHKVFMSDDLWQKLDFFDVKMNISHHYLAESRLFETQDKRAIRDLAGCLPFVPDRSLICTGCNKRGAKLCEVCLTYRSGACLSCVEVPWRCERCAAIARYTRSKNAYVAVLVLINNAGCIGNHVRELNTKLTDFLVKEHGLLQYMPADRPETMEGYRRAVSLRPHSLKWLDPQLQNDIDIICLALRQDSSAVEHVSPELWQDRRVYTTYMAHQRRNVKRLNV